jgi:serine/threonine-protein kinase
VTQAGEISSSGTAVGTVGYMSPEQALGKAVDARTDLFALGVVLYEMGTGRRPFTGDTPAAVFDQLLHGRPPSPVTLNPALPVWLATLMEKALEKDPDRRYRSAEELLGDLQRIDAATAAASTTAGRPVPRADASSIVVLPFEDMSPQHDQEYFCHGITEEIISTLARVSGLRVISRTSAFAFQGQKLDVTEIGRRLRVGAVLEGSVRTSGDLVRITAQLVDAEDGYQRWSKRFDREMSDILAIQDEIAGSIVRELQSGLAGPVQRRPSIDVVAHDTYLRGMYALNKWTDDAMRLAIADFRAAIAQDAAFAPAYAALAEGQVWLYSGLGVLSARDTVPQARWAIEKALELDPTLVDAHKVRGLIAMNHDWDRKEAAEALTRAVQLGPGSPTAHLWNAWRLALLERRHEEALVELGEAERLDPLDLQVKTQIGYIHRFQRQADRAIQQFEKVLALEPSFAFGHYALADACVQQGEYDRAFAEFDRAIALGGRSVNLIGVLGYASGRAGNRDRAKEHLGELTARAEHGYVPAMWIALVHLGLGDVDSLFAVLDRAFEERDGSLVLITGAVEFDPVREDPRFTSLLGRMGLGHLASSPV